MNDKGMRYQCYKGNSPPFFVRIHDSRRDPYCMHLKWYDDRPSDQSDDPQKQTLVAQFDSEEEAAQFATENAGSPTRWRFCGNCMPEAAEREKARRATDGKYSPLVEHLVELNVNAVTLSFNAIEEILEAKLPPSARDHDAWWSNGGHDWGIAWSEAGWQRVELDREGELVTFRRTGSEQVSVTDEEAIEGYLLDRRIVTRSRDANLVKLCKERDQSKCRACGLQIAVNGIRIIDVHHMDPLGETEGEVTTSLDKLLCLCPTCHRIAHTRKPPYDPNEIAEILEDHRVKS